MLRERLGHAPGQLMRNGQSGPAEAGGGDAQHAARGIHQRTTGEARIRGGIGADVLLEGQAAAGPQRPADEADDADAGHRAMVGWPTHCQDDLADSRRAAGGVGRLELQARGFQDGQVAAWVAPHELYGDRLAVAVLDAQVLVALDDVVGGENQAFGVDDAAGRLPGAAFDGNQRGRRRCHRVGHLVGKIGKSVCCHVTNLDGLEGSPHQTSG